MEGPVVKVKYIMDVPELEKIENGDWIDLCAAVDVSMNKFDFKMIPLGIAMQLPEGYEAHIVPRSSTFKKYGIIQTNGTGIVDNSYCGDNDMWYMPVFCLKTNNAQMDGYTFIPKGSRICQFRLVRKMDTPEFAKVDHLGNEDRGGFGSTGV